jgi:hypothetical protein
MGSALNQLVDQCSARRFAHVVGVRLERESPDRESHVRQIAAEALHDLRRKAPLLRAVHRFDRPQNRQSLTALFPGL